MKKIQLILTMMISMLFSMPAWAEVDSPKGVVESTITLMIKILNDREDKTIISSKDREAIRDTVEGRFDYQKMAMRSLGKPWKKLGKDEKLHFTEVFRDLLERSYGNRLSEYNGQTVVFADAIIKKKKALVKSTVVDGARETPVDYKLHQTKSGWQVYDIRIEGTSMVRTFHQDFKSTLSSGGYKELVIALEKKVAKLKAKDHN